MIFSATVQLFTVEAIIQQQNDDIEVLKKELYKYQHSSDVAVKRDIGVQFTFMEPVSGIMIYGTLFMILIL